MAKQQAALSQLLGAGYPLNGKVKVNFDGASFGNLGPTAFSCVVRDHQGRVVLVDGLA